MTAPVKVVPCPSPADEERDGLPQWLLTTDHKRIGLLTISTALVLFFLNGALVLTMRARPITASVVVSARSLAISFASLTYTNSLVTS